MIPVPNVTDVDAVFGGNAMKILPPLSQIPDEFKNCNRPTKWSQVVSDWFFFGLSNAKWTPKEGVKTLEALKAVQCCIGSFEPSHEHKEAGCAYLLSQWFEDVTYIRADKKK